MRALCKENFEIENISSADDTVVMEHLIEIVKSYNETDKGEIILDARNAGTVFRFYTAFLSANPGNYILTGDDRMKQRPVGPLVEALKDLGANIEYLDREGYPPLKIRGKHLKGGEVEIDAGISSQFVSALLMIAPLMNDGISMKLKGEIASKPYIDMTLGLMKELSIKSEWIDDMIKVDAQQYSPKTITVESDWSSASYWYLMAALSENADLVINDLRHESLQGDSVLPVLFENFGVKTEYIEEGIHLTKSYHKTDHFEYDFAHNPDLAQSVAVCCAGLNIPAELKGLKSLKIKETDRLIALQNEISKLGNPVKITEDEIDILPRTNKKLQPLIIKTYNDHRMAMSFAPLAMIIPEVMIDSPDVVSKSYPGYWDDLQKVGFEIEFHAK